MTTATAQPHLRVGEIWRYPVKSMRGERLRSAQVTARGLPGDRAFAVVDVETGAGLTARREPRLLFATAGLRDDGSPVITLPDGSIARDDAALSAWLGRAVALRAAASGDRLAFEAVEDFEAETSWTAFPGARDTFHDSTWVRLSLVSRATIGDWAAPRFRANVVLDGGGEDELIGLRVQLGGAVLAVAGGIARCVMVTRPQPDGIERDLDVLRRIHRERRGLLAVGAGVEQPGVVEEGEVVRLLPPGPAALASGAIR